MTGLPDPRTDAAWSAVLGLVERWAMLPPASWRMLVLAEHLRTESEPPRAPDAMVRWLVRDLVDTAWNMAIHRSPVKPEPWTDDARRVLEHLAWRLLE